jgi:O-antigen/teichoic acid export membrane protein
VSHTHSVLGNFTWSLLNSLSLFIYGFVVSALIARLLGDGPYGDYTYLVWLYTVVTLVATLGAGQTITKYVSEWSVTQQLGQAAALVRGYLLLQLGALGLLTAGLWMALQQFPWLLGKVVPADLLLVALFIALPVTVNGTLTVSLQGLQRFKGVAVTGLASVLTSLALIGLAALYDPTIHLFLTIVVVAQLLAVALNLWFLRDFLTLKGSLPTGLIRPLLTYALGIYLIAFIDLVVWQRSEIYFLGRFAPREQIGFYNLAFGLINASIFLVVMAFNSVLVPVFTRLWHEDARALEVGYFRTTKLAGLFVLPAAVGLSVLAPHLVRLIYGPAFAPVAPLIWVLAISVGLSAIAGAGSALMYSQGKHWFSVKIGIPLAVINILLDVWLIPQYLAMGAAWANTTTQVLGVAAGTIFTLVTFKVKLPLASLLKSLLAALLMGGVIWLAGWLVIGDLAYILLALPLGVVVYTVLVLGLRVLDATDILMLRSVEEGLSGRLAVWAGRGVNFLERFAKT